MKILIVGGGPGSGASIMRAEQLGAAIGARVHVEAYQYPPREAVDEAEVVIVVKRLKKRWLKWFPSLKSKGKRVAWDAIDFWEQPEENNIPLREAVRSFLHRRNDIMPRLVLAATKKMAEDCRAIYLPHHHRIGLLPEPPRERVEAVGYEGNEKFIEAWRPAIEAQCARRGWRFVLNPDRLTDLDIVLALRGGDWDGAICRRWKSGVKYVNSLAAGRPVITQASAAFTEIGPPGTVIQNEGELAAALDSWAPFEARQKAFERGVALEPQYRIEVIAAQYRAILSKHLGPRR